MRVVLTGTSGQLGAYLLDRLADMRAGICQDRSTRAESVCGGMDRNSVEQFTENLCLNLL